MTRASWERIDVLFRFLLTGGKALAFGLLIWYSLLAVTWLLSVSDISRHKITAPSWPFYFFQSDWGLALIYGGAFFFAALLAARSRRSCCPALAAFLAYAGFVAVLWPNLMRPGSGLWCFLLPLLTAPSGGWLGGRIYWRLQR